MIWDVAPYSLVCRYYQSIQHPISEDGNLEIHHCENLTYIIGRVARPINSSTLKTEAAGYSETLVLIYQTTQPHIIQYVLIINATSYLGMGSGLNAWKEELREQQT
jgi:hypothetical protein